MGHPRSAGSKGEAGKSPPSGSWLPPSPPRCLPSLKARGCKLVAHRHVCFSWQVHLITSKFGSLVSLEKSDDLALLRPIPAWQRSGGAEWQLRRQKAFPTLPRASVSRSWPVSFIYFTCLAPRALNLQPVFERKHLPKPRHRKRKKKAELLWLKEDLISGLSPALPCASPRTSGLSGTQRETPGSRSLLFGSCFRRSC